MTIDEKTMILHLLPVYHQSNSKIDLESNLSFNQGNPGRACIRYPHVDGVMNVSTLHSVLFDCATKATDYSGNYSLEQAEDYQPTQDNIRNNMEYDLPLVFEPLVRIIIITR